MGRWRQVDPEAEQFYGMSPYVGMGNNPVNAADPNGDIPFFIIPNFGFNKGGFNIGMEVGIGVKGVASLSTSAGFSAGQGGTQLYRSVQGGYYPLFLNLKAGPNVNYPTMTALNLSSTPRKVVIIMTAINWSVE